NEYAVQYTDLLNSAEVRDAVAQATSWLKTNAVRLTNTLATGVINAGYSFFHLIFALFMSLVVAFWLSMDLPKFHRESMIIAGPKRAENFEVMISVFARSLGGYLKGLVITSACTGTLAGIGYAILGVPYSGLLGLLTGLLNIIPFIGPWIGGISAALVGFFVSPLTALLTVVVSFASQQITDNFISPKVMQSAVSVHPMLVILGLAAGGALAGIPGMIFAVPLLAAAKSLYTYYFEKKTGRQLVSEDGGIFLGKPFNDENGNPIPAFDATGGQKYYSGEFASPRLKRLIKNFNYKKVQKEKKRKEREKALRAQQSSQRKQSSSKQKDDNKLSSRDDTNE
ncbi:MAG: AI-2E family transporter, partial [Coriobacteriia bacterium]|nr:AI-2E family transporter [Coriobacteriia bacterium]